MKQQTEFLQEFQPEDAGRAVEETLRVIRNHLENSRGFTILGIASHGEESTLMTIAGGEVRPREFARMLTAGLLFGRKLVEQTSIMKCDPCDCPDCRAEREAQAAEEKATVQ